MRYGLGACAFLICLTAAASAQVEDWTYSYDSGTGSNEFFHSAVADNTGNLYILGSKSGAFFTSSVVVAKVKPDGTEAWRQTVPSSGPFNFPGGIKIDENFNVFVSCTATPSGGNADISLVKYNSNGVKQWQSFANGSANGADSARGLTFDTLGNIYVTGLQGTASADSSMLVAKFNPSGVLQWSKSGATSKGDDVGLGCIWVPLQGRLIVYGYTFTILYGQDACYWRFDALGNEYMHETFLGDDDEDEAVVKALLFSDGHLGHLRTAGLVNEPSDIIFSRGEGVNSAWSAYYGAPVKGDDWAVDFEIDSQENVVFGGSSFESAANGKGWVIQKRTPGGQEQWTQRFDSPGLEPNLLGDLAVDWYGFTYAAGPCLQDAAVGDQIVLKKYDPIGNNTFTSVVDCISESRTFVHAFANGDILVCGTTRTPNSNMFVKKYDQLPEALNDTYTLPENGSITVAANDGVLKNDLFHYTGNVAEQLDPAGGDWCWLLMAASATRPRLVLRAATPGPTEFSGVLTTACRAPSPLRFSRSVPPNSNWLQTLSWAGRPAPVRSA